MAASPPGFTLVELLVALAILTALVAMAAGVFQSNVDDSKLTVRDANLRAVRLAIQAFFNDHGRYPYNGQDNHGNVVHLLDNGTSELVQGVHDGFGVYPDRPAKKGKRTRYLREIPIDPTTGRADWILIPYDNDGDWSPARGDDTDGDGNVSAGDKHVDEDPFGSGDEDQDGKVDEDPPDVRDVRSRNP